MDFSFELDPEIYIVPRNYEWSTLLTDQKLNNKYQFIGTGQNIGQITFSEGVNEKGLAAAALYFKGFAHFKTEMDKNSNNITISTTELVGFLLGSCQDIEDVIDIVNNIEIIGVKDAITDSISPLHWFISDRLGRCITIEITTKGLEIFDNKIKVLTNSPNFEWHMTNLRNYINLSKEQIEEVDWNNISLKPFGQAAGTFGLPGDFTSPARFVRTAFIQNCVLTTPNILNPVKMCFNIMKSVTIPKGLVITERGTYDYTQYTVFMNIMTGDYYFTTHDNNIILMANIGDSYSKNIVSLGKLKRIKDIEHI